MSLIDELKVKKSALLDGMREIDREAARVREQFEEALNNLRKERLPLEERMRLIDALIKAEEGQDALYRPEK